MSADTPHDEDPSIDIVELFERVNDLEAQNSALEERVDELENEDASGNGSVPSGLDHRDVTVLEEIENRGHDVGPRATLKLYQHYTDVSNETTAKKRAKTLRNHPEFKKVVGQ